MKRRPPRPPAKPTPPPPALTPASPIASSPVTILASLLIAALIGGASTYGFIHYRQEGSPQDLLSKLLRVKQELSATKDDLLGYTKFTDYLTESKKAIEGQTKFLAAKVDREYVQVEHIQKSTLGWKSDATIILTYAVEYSFGFDLLPDRFTVTGDTSGITITVSKPELVASPAVNMLSHEIPATGIFIDEQAAVITLQQQLFTMAQKRAKDIQREETVTALCEKKLGDFLRDFLSRQPNVRLVPVIKFAYK